MSLQDKLDEIKAGFQKKADSESMAVMGKATEALNRSDILDQALKAGDSMPEFTLATADGEKLNSQELLDRGPLVVNFFRGLW